MVYVHHHSSLRDSAAGEMDSRGVPGKELHRARAGRSTRGVATFPGAETHMPSETQAPAAGRRVPKPATHPRAGDQAGGLANRPTVLLMLPRLCCPPNAFPGPSGRCTLAHLVLSRARLLPCRAPWLLLRLPGSSASSSGVCRASTSTSTRTRTRRGHACSSDPARMTVSPLPGGPGRLGVPWGASACCGLLGNETSCPTQLSSLSGSMSDSLFSLY